MNERPHTELIDLIPPYALGILNEEEREQVTRHLKTCATCRDELAAYESITDSMAMAVPPEMPPPDLKQKLKGRIPQKTYQAMEETSQPMWKQRLTTWRRRLPDGLRWQPAFVFVIIVVVFLVGAFFIWQQAIVPSNRQIELTATDTAPNASGIIEITNDGREATLTVSGLPVLTQENQYQLWLIQDGQRVSGAVFSVNENGTANVPIDSGRPLIEYGAFGITIEPAGGSPGPTGDRVLGFNL
jgi:anti-sigma-K factor RskA